MSQIPDDKNEPHLVYYKYPIIGHTIDYHKESTKFIKECHEKYGEIFSLYVFGQIITIVGGELSPEIFKNHKEFSFNAAIDEFFPLHGFMGRPREFLSGLTTIVQRNLSGDLKFYTNRVQGQLLKSIDEIIGDGKVLQPPLKSLQLLVAKPVAAAVAEEFTDDKELINSFAYSVNDISSFLSFPPILHFISPKLHQKFLITFFRIANNPFVDHRETIKRKITPVVKKRLSEMKKLDGAYTPPVDILQNFIDMFGDDIDSITDYIISLIFAAVHTTSTSLNSILQEFVNNPQFHEELLEEQKQLFKSKENDYYTIEQISKLERLDSMVRETFRLYVGASTLPHKVLSPYYTFSSGHQVPKGRNVYIRVKEIHNDDKIHGQNSKEFNAFRHLESKSPASRVEKNFLTFGFGKHACPGRFFAVNEIKIALHYLLLKYDIRKVGDEKINPLMKRNPTFPSVEGLLFEKRKSII
ncbi:20710_t:CDS:2 [Funneliformis geosporum]|nr:20710_t:CDS:2 [Funneliformis geosporum]